MSPRTNLLLLIGQKESPSMKNAFLKFSSAFSIVAILLGVRGVTSALADDNIAVVDQSNVVDVRLIDSIQILGPIGQEFTPSISGLDEVELWTEDFGPGNGQETELQVFIRARTIDGPILGTSLVTSLPDNFQGITSFNFPDLVSLRPGELYVIQIIVLSGDNVLLGHNWGVGSSGGPESTYPGGTWIVLGQPEPGNDLWFREGFAGPTPQTRDYCKKNLWQYLVGAGGSHFKSQGDCIQFVNAGE
jgi:hypothetical protein